MRIFLVFLLLVSSMRSGWADQDKKLEVVVSFSILADFTKVIGGAHVRVTSIIPPDSDPHVYQPTPEVTTLISHADLVIMNGLGFEGWIDRLLGATDYKGLVTIATQGITPRTLLDPALPSAPPVPDPHAWHDVRHAMVYVKNISDALIRLDPAHQKDYKARTRSYLQQLHNLDTWIRGKFSRIPQKRRKIISAHDAFGYLAVRYGIKIYALQGISTESEPSARQIADLVQLIRKHHIRALFSENIKNHQLLEQIAHETNIETGGVLYSDALSGDTGPATTYLEFMRYNVTTLCSVLEQN